MHPEKLASRESLFDIAGLSILEALSEGPSGARIFLRLNSAKIRNQVRRVMKPGTGKLLAG